MPRVRKYSPDQDRDERGRFAEEGAGGGRTATDDEPKPGSARDTQNKVDQALRDSKRATAIGKATGFPDERIIITRGVSPTFKVGDQEFTEGGHYDPRTGEVTLHGDSAYEDGIVAHEIQHARWHTVMDQYNRDWSEVREHDNAARESGDPQYAPKGRLLTPAAAAIYPTYAAISPHLEPTFDDLRKEDGVTEYSAAYWEKWSSGKDPSTAGYNRAVNETLAEMYRREAPYEGAVPAEMWHDRPHLASLRNAIHAEFVRLGGHR